jgi:hypothetical protein
MATVSLIDPYSQQAEEIARRQRMAQALQEQGSQVLEMPTTPGVTISPYAGLAKMLQTGFGAYQERKAREDYAKLQTEYRKNYNTQFENFARALSAPAQAAFAGQEAVPGQEAIPAQPAVMAPQIEKSFGGYGMPREVGQYEVSPAIAGKEAVPGQAAIPARPALPAGYISPETVQGIDIPEVKQLAMARYLAQFEPKAPIKGSPGDVFFDPTTGKERFKVPAAAKAPIKGSPGDVFFDPTTGEKQFSVPAAAGTTTLSPLGKLQSERAAIAATNPNDPRLATYDNAIAKESQDQNLVFQREKFEYEKGNPGFTLEKVRNADGGESVVAVNKGSAVARPVMGVDGKALTSAAPSKKVRVEITAADGSTKTVLMDESDTRLAEGLATKGPDYVSITEVNPKGETVVRQVKKDDAILATGYVKPLDGFLGQLQAAGVPMDKIQSDPKIMDLVNRYFVKTAGGVAPEEAAGFELRKAEVVARLGELGIAIPANIKGLSLSATPGVLGGAQPAGAAAPAPAVSGTKTAPLPLPSKISDYKTGQYYLTNKGVLLFNGSKFVD